MSIHPPKARTRIKTAVGLTLAAGLAATGITVAFAEGDEPSGPSQALVAAEVRAEQTPEARRDQWLEVVGEYARTEAIREYALAVYARAVAWQGAARYAEALAAQQAAEASYSSGGSSSLADIRACESGGNYGAVSSSGTYRGAYQFDSSTWQSVGGSGDPAAASPGEQDMRAQMLMNQSGSSPWPVCG